MLFEAEIQKFGEPCASRLRFRWRTTTITSADLSGERRPDTARRDGATCDNCNAAMPSFVLVVFQPMEFEKFDSFSHESTKQGSSQRYLKFLEVIEPTPNLLRGTTEWWQASSPGCSEVRAKPGVAESLLNRPACHPARTLRFMSGRNGLMALRSVGWIFNPSSLPSTYSTV